MSLYGEVSTVSREAGVSAFADLRDFAISTETLERLRPLKLDGCRERAHRVDIRDLRIPEPIAHVQSRHSAVSSRRPRWRIDVRYEHRACGSWIDPGQHVTVLITRTYGRESWTYSS